MCRRKGSILILVLLLHFSLSSRTFAEPSETEMATCELLTLCHQAMLLYYNKEFVLPNYPEKHNLVTTLRGPSKDELFGFISETPTRIFVVFRGSQSVRDFKRDINCFKVPFYLVPNGGRVHQGFLTTYTKVGKDRLLSLRNFILRTLTGLDPTKKLYITGHSMGGALATICALDMAAHSPFPQPLLYTFASPRVGDHTFVNTFNETINTCIRVKNQYDYVPATPLKCMGYEHVKGAMVIKVKTNSIEKHHRIDTAYFPGIMARFTHLIQDLLRFNPAGLIPPVHFPKIHSTSDGE